MAFLQNGRRDIQCQLGTGFIVVPASIKAVDADEALFEMLRLDKGVTGRAFNGKCAFEKCGYCTGVGSILPLQSGKIIHGHGEVIPTKMEPVTDADSVDDALLVEHQRTIVDTAHVLYKNIDFQRFSMTGADLVFIIPSGALPDAHELTIYEDMRPVMQLGKDQIHRFAGTGKFCRVKQVTEILAYDFTLSTAEDAEFLIRNTRELILSQKMSSGEEDVQRVIDTTYPVEIGFTEEGRFSMRIPILIPKQDGYSVKYLENRLDPVLREFWDSRPPKKFPYYEAVLVFRHVYDVKRPPWERCVPANGEIDCVIKLIFKHMLYQAFPIEFRHYHSCAVGEEECTEVYVIPISEFEKWLSQETSVMEILSKGEKLLESPADAMRAREIRAGNT